MTRIIRLALCASLLLGLLSVAVAPRPARAQGVTCNSYFFPQSTGGWTITNGTDMGDGTVQSTVTELPGGGTGALIDLNVDLAGPIYLYSVKFNWYTTVLSQWTYGNVQAIYNGEVLRSLNAIESQPFSWQDATFYFESPVVNNLHFVLSNATSPTGFTVITMAAVQICGGSAYTLTPTPTDTFTPSPTPVNSPTPTYTPTITHTPTSGPSPTASNTIPPKIETGNSATPKSIFATVPPPQQCADFFNPCGPIPWDPIFFPTITLPSVTPVVATPLLPTGTLIGTPTPAATNTGTVTPETPTATPTFNGGQGQIATFVSDGENASNQLVATPGLFDPSGPLATLPDSANQVGQHIGDFFGIVRAVQGFFLGKTGTIIFFLLLILLYVIMVRLILFALPIIIKIFDLLLQLIQAILPW